MQKIKIGTARLGYPEVRCIVNNDFFEVKSLESRDFYKYKNKLRNLLGMQSDGYVFQSLIPDEMNGLDFYHMFNYIPITDKFWGGTFETSIPRIPDIVDIHRKNDDQIDYSSNLILEKLLRKLAKNNCIFVNALSKKSLDIQRKITDFYPDIKSIIDSKSCILHPPQKIYMHDKDANFNDRLRIIFVGRDFYRKGGGEVVLAIDSLVNDGLLKDTDIELTLVGDLNKKYNYVHNDFQDDAVFYNKIENIISSRKYIYHASSLANADLLNTMENQDLGLLPTWGDTYGYSVLEMKSFMLPVITTSVRALPEINEHSNIIELELNMFGEIVINSEKDKVTQREMIISGLKSKVNKFINDRSSLITSARIGTEQLKKQHDPTKYFQKLYQEISNVI